MEDPEIKEVAVAASETVPLVVGRVKTEVTSESIEILGHRKSQ